MLPPTVNARIEAAINEIIHLRQQNENYKAQIKALVAEKYRREE